MGDWVSLLGMDEAREEYWITDEEDGCVVADQIPVAILRVEFDGKATRVAGCVS